jgi:perosamine synthetase
MINWPRHQLPARSPLPFAALARATSSLRPVRGGTSAATEELRSVLEGHLHASSIVLCGSGTQALALALCAALGGRGGAGLVALPAYSCFDLVTALVSADARATFYDVDPLTLSPDMASFEAALATGATVVVVAPLYGVPVDWHGIKRAAAAAGAVVIEDAAQTFGARYDGRPAGVQGDLTVLSFGRGKGWTGGRGGAMLVRAADAGSHVENLLVNAAASARIGSWARAAAASVLGRPWSYAFPASLPWLQLGSTIYHEPSPLELMDGTAAALLLASRAAAEAEVAVRRANADAYRRELGESPGWQHVAVPPLAHPSWLRYPLRLTCRRAALQSGALKRLGVTAGYPQPLPELPAMAARTVAPRVYPGAVDLVRHLIALPTHGLVSRADRAAVQRLLAELQAVSAYTGGRADGPAATPDRAVS